MSNTQFAFLAKQRVPNRTALQQSIDRLGFDLQLEPDFTPHEDAGSSPCRLEGVDQFGFEIYYDSAAGTAEGDQGLLDIAAGRDYCITMTWGGSLADCACVMIVSCALASDFDAVVTYEGEPPESLENLLSSTRDVLAEASSEISEARG